MWIRICRIPHVLQMDRDPTDCGYYLLRLVLVTRLSVATQDKRQQEFWKHQPNRSFQ